MKKNLVGLGNALLFGLAGGIGAYVTSGRFLYWAGFAFCMGIVEENRRTGAFNFLFKDLFSKKSDHRTPSVDA